MANNNPIHPYYDNNFKKPIHIVVCGDYCVMFVNEEEVGSSKLIKISNILTSNHSFQFSSY